MTQLQEAIALNKKSNNCLDSALKLRHRVSMQLATMSTAREGTAWAASRYQTIEILNARIADLLEGRA